MTALEHAEKAEKKARKTAEKAEWFSIVIRTELARRKNEDGPRLRTSVLRDRAREDGRPLRARTTPRLERELAKADDAARAARAAQGDHAATVERLLREE